MCCCGGRIRGGFRGGRRPGLLEHEGERKGMVSGEVGEPREGEGEGEGEGENRAVLYRLRSFSAEWKGTYIVTHSSSLSSRLCQRDSDTLDVPVLFAQTRSLGKRNNETCAGERDESVYVCK